MLKGLRKRGGEAQKAEKAAQAPAATTESALPPFPETGSPAPSVEKEPGVHNRIDRVARFANGDSHSQAAGTAEAETQGSSAAGDDIQDAGAVVRPDEQVLTVGRGIRLNAEMCECDTLFVEGDLKAKAHSKVLRIAKGGTFRGEAEVEFAEIAGSFQGKLRVTQRLTLRSSGICDGRICYGEILVDAGGHIGGEVRWAEESEAPAEAPTSTALITPPARAISDKSAPGEELLLEEEVAESA